MDVDNSGLSVDGVFDALRNAERRKLLDSLISDSPPDDAARSGIVVDADLAMYHTHLPKLADYGLINWDREACLVTKGPDFEAAAEVLTFLKESSSTLSLKGNAA